MTMRTAAISRAGLCDVDDAWAIVSEYYDAVGVVVREDRPGFLGAEIVCTTGVACTGHRGTIIGRPA